MRSRDEIGETQRAAVGKTGHYSEHYVLIRWQGEPAFVTRSGPWPYSEVPDLPAQPAPDAPSERFGEETGSAEK
jgi:hypothetical protein